MTICRPPNVPKQHTFDEIAMVLNKLSDGKAADLAVISELERDPEIVSAEQADDVLKLVFGGR